MNQDGLRHQMDLLAQDTHERTAGCQILRRASLTHKRTAKVREDTHTIMPARRRRTRLVGTAPRRRRRLRRRRPQHGGNVVKGLLKMGRALLDL